MKRFISLSLAVAGSVLLGACASTQPTAVFHAPSVSPVKHAVTQAEKHVSNARSVAKKIEADCPKSKAEIRWLSDELQQSYDWLEQGQKEIDKLKGQIATETKRANKVAGERDTAVAHDRETTAKYHKVKLVGAGIVGGLGTLVGAFVIRFLAPFLGPYAFFALSLGPIAAVAFYLRL